MMPFILCICRSRVITAAFLCLLILNPTKKAETQAGIDGDTQPQSEHVTQRLLHSVEAKNWYCPMFVLLQFTRVTINASCPPLTLHTYGLSPPIFGIPKLGKTS